MFKVTSSGQADSALMLLIWRREMHPACKNLTPVMPTTSTGKGATTGGWGVRTPKIWTNHPNCFDEECDYRYVTDCSPRNWVYHPYFVLYNNRDQGIGPPTLKTWLRPCPQVVFCRPAPTSCGLIPEKRAAVKQTVCL